MELITILGPILSKSAVFPDSEAKLAKIYFASSNEFAEEESREMYGFGLGARNFGDVQSAMESLRGTVASIQVCEID